MKILRHNPWILLLLKAGVAGLLLGGLSLYLDPVRIWHKLQQLDRSDLWSAAALCSLGILVQWIKWQRLLAFFRPQTTWAEGLNSLLIGFALGLVSPGRLGELGRGILLGGKQSTWVGLSAVDRLCSAAICVTLGWVGSVFLYPSAAQAALALGILFAGLAGLARARLSRGLRQWEWLGRIAAVIGQTPGRVWLQVCLWSVLFNLIFFVQFYILLASWGSLPTGALWGIPLFFGLKVLLPFSIMDLGVREGVAVLVFTPLQLDPTVAFNAAFLQFILNVLIPGLAGWLLLGGQLYRRLGRGIFRKGPSALSLDMRP